MSSSREPLLAFSVLIIVFSVPNHVFSKNTTYYILHWTIEPKQNSYLYLGNGRKAFIKNQCKHTNCYVTKNKKMFPELTRFDAVLFDVTDLNRVRHPRQLPSPIERSPHQKYIFASVETAAHYPACKDYLNDYFNWTWTFRLDSDFRKGYLTVYNLKGEVVGPKKNKKWPRKMMPISEGLKYKLRYKTELAAWFVSNCRSKDRRRVFMNRVQEVLLAELRSETVDIFGRCGRFGCPKSSSKCARMLQRDYYFYMAFENSFATDYITEKVITALDNYNVPVVYGAADYTRLLPPGSYLNARELGPEKLARRMVQIKANLSAYHDFFRWRNHYKYKETTSTEDTCSLCAMMNDEKKRTESTTVNNFLAWWNEGPCVQSKQ